jgi:hypothetical protein
MTMTVEPGVDHKRREDILRRTLMGIEEDLEDLRDELARILVDYEGRLNRTCNELPDWLVLAPLRLRRNFLFPEDDPFASCVLGPRHAAFIATRVEAFVETWLGTTDAPREHDGEGDELRLELDADVAELEAFFEQAFESSTLLLTRARGDLEALLDQIVMDIEVQRETDVDALEALVHEGELEAGRDSQEEIANIWEQQRWRVEEVHSRWEAIEDLLEEGLRISQRTTSELQALFARALQGLGGAYEELAVSIELPQGDGFYGEPKAIDDELDEAPPAIGSEDFDQAGDTLPGVETGPAIVEAPAVEVVKPVRRSHESLQRLEVEDAGAPGPLATASLACPCFRVRQAWVPIGTVELSTVLLPPALSLLGMVTLGVGHLFGAAPNPILEWHWALPVIGVSMVWLVILPLVLQWRPSWRGLRPLFVRTGELIDEAELRLDQGRLTMDRMSWSLTEVRRMSRGRWESRQDGTRGWLVEIEPPYHRPLVIACSVTDLESWEASQLPVTPVPDDVWLTEPADYEALEVLASRH